VREREYLRTYRRERWQLRASERLDVLEDEVLRAGCNVRTEGRAHCGKRVTVHSYGPFGLRQLCSEHAALYAEHSRILARILAAEPRGLI